MYRGKLKGILVLLSSAQAGPGRGAQRRTFNIQRSAKVFVRGCEKFVPALAHLLCLPLPGSCLARFAYFFADLCILSKMFLLSYSCLLINEMSVSSFVSAASAFSHLSAKRNFRAGQPSRHPAGRQTSGQARDLVMTVTAV